jgi:predicted ATPase/signal transduction histidine kinase
MMAATVKIPGYAITERIYIGTRTIVYKAVRECNQAPVAIKLMRNPDPSFDEIVNFCNQYTIAANLNIPGIVKPYSLEMHGNGYALVMEYGGISLKEWLASVELTIPHFLQIAIQITTTLDLLHRNRVIHKDIKPANILINLDTLLLKITDFSISSLFLRDQQLQRNILEGTLAYISPEQTGRINRSVDYRSDFYSLGITFYELLTKQLPFNTNEPSELVHCHITKQPVAVDAINKDIPKVLAVIVSKLMAKNPEERYQSARGLKYDLKACLDLYQENQDASNILYFPLASRDVSDRFLIPEKLYGREAEVKVLLDAFARLCPPPTSPLFKGRLRGDQILLLRGFSGTGKTALVNEVQKPIVRANGYFIKGKYDQFARNVPFFGFVQAFRNLIEQLLTESESRILEWKNRILDAVGENGQFIIDVIPDVELLIGKQSPCTELESTAARNRFNLIFQKFIRVFCSAEYPLVIFLDDLQWADAASLQLIYLLVVEELEYLLLIGAYRDNEVNKTHRLISTIDDIQNAGATVETITLNALSFDAVNQLVADTLNSHVDKTSSLTEYIYSKTQGNSFFTRELLNTLYQEQVIYFDYEYGIWQWELNAAQNLPLSNNVVEFMVSKLLSLPTVTQDVLKLAACIGNQFDLQMLATISERTVHETAAALWNSIQSGLILTTSQVHKYLQFEADSVLSPEQLAFTFQFLHDRVQQAAYTLSDDATNVHLKIGRLLLNSIAPEKREERVFDLVNQLNYGVELITHQVERDELARLNLIACRKARSATAYSAASEYVKVGIKLLGEDGWQQQYEVILALHELGAEVAYLCGDLQQMEYFVNQVTHRAGALLHQIKVYEIKIQAYISQNRFVDAIQSALAILLRLDIKFPELPTPEDKKQAMAEVATYIDENSINDLSALAPIQNEEMLAATRILSSVASAAYIGMAQLYPLIILKQVSISIQYGNAPSSAYAYATYGLILCAFGNDIEAGNRSGNAALKLLDLFKANEFKAKVTNLVYPFVRPWKTHLQVLTQPLLDGYHSGLETGDLEYGAYCAFNYCNLCYWSGKNLAWLVDEMELYNQAMLQIKQETARNFLRLFHQAALNITTINLNPICLNGAVYNELEMLPIHIAAGDSYSIGTLYLHKLILCVLFDDHEQGVENTILAEQYAGAIAGTYYSSLIPFYASLCQLGIYSTQSVQQQQVILETVKQNQDKIRNWANHAPMNHLHKWYLVEAEQHRVLNNKIEAIDCYDKAIALAQENGYINEEALCWELAAKFYLEWEKSLIAQTYITKAYQAYQHWGAKAKLTHLTSKYPQLLASLQSIIPNIKTDQFATISSSSTTASEYLDFKAVLKASQSLSSEIHIDKLVSNLMQVVLENAGADQGVLLLLKNNMLEVAAHSHNYMCNVQLPENLINYARYARKSIIINNVGASIEFTEDAYFQINHPQSVLCTPIINQSRLIGVLYLENNLVREAFTSDRVEILNLLCSQAAISLLNATLYQTSQNDAQKLKQNLTEQKILAAELQQTLEELKDAQTQLVQNEKMSALGNLVAGVAHEINNPVGFIAGNIQPALNFVNDIFRLLDLYQEKFPDPGAEICEEIETIDLDYVRQDLPKLLSSMKEGVQRIRSISNSLRTFSRADTETKITFDIHDGLNSTVMILSHRLKANEHRPQIEILKNYAKLPQIRCFPGQLNQVFMNLLANAIDALEESNIGRSFEEIQLNPNRITIKTSLSTDAQKVIVYIKDNGKGMSEEVKQRIFDHLFTTKAVGKGTGIGLAIARQIIIEKHGGSIKVNSILGEGAEFLIEIPVD